VRILPSFLDTKVSITIPQKQKAAFRVSAKSARSRNLFCGAASKEQSVPGRPTDTCGPGTSRVFCARLPSSHSGEERCTELLETLFLQVLRIPSAWTDRLARNTM